MDNISLPQGINTAISAGAPIATSAIVGSSLAVPIVGAAIAGVTLLIGGWLSGIAKRNAEKVQATAIVNQAEPYLQKNLDAFRSIQNPTQADKDQALANFDNIWAQVVSALHAPSLSDVEEQSINDRSPGGKYDWTSYYRTPIVNTVIVAPPASETNTTVQQFTDAVSNTLAQTSPLVVYGGVGLIGLIVVNLLLGGRK
jgi:hypothetical protein